MLHGSRVVPGTVLGLESGNRTRGHRFMGAAEIVLGGADEYEKKLLDDGKVLADFDERKTEIDRQLQAEAKKQTASLGEYQILLDEVDGAGRAPERLRWRIRPGVPRYPAGMPDPHHAAEPEVLPALRRRRKAAAEIPDRVQHAGRRPAPHRRRATSAWCDRGSRMRASSSTRTASSGWRSASRSSRKVVYHNKLGSQLDRVERIQLLAGKIRPAARRRRAARRARRRARQGGSAHRHGRRVSGTAGHHGALLRAARRRAARRSPTRSKPTTGRDLPATRCPKVPLPAPWRSPTSSTHWSACSASANSQPATRIRSACAARRWAWSESWWRTTTVVAS